MADSKVNGLDLGKFVRAAQVGGIERYELADGEARGSRVLCFNTGAGLRFRVLVDRGFDIDQASHNQHSLTFLAHKGVTPPTRALDRGIDWLKGFPVGLLTSCGPFSIGAACEDAGEHIGLHSVHSNTAVELESVIQPGPHRGQLEMSATAVVRYGAVFGPSVELKRTIRAQLMSNKVEFEDVFYNAGNTVVPHAWLLHMNLGWPLVDEGAEFVWGGTLEARSDPASQAWFGDKGRNPRAISGLQPSHVGTGEVFTYIDPRVESDGTAVVGVINPKLGLKFDLRYDAVAFPRCGCWQHWGEREYVCALEPMNGSVSGRDKDRAAGILDSLAPRQAKTYRYSIETSTSI